MNSKRFFTPAAIVVVGVLGWASTQLVAQSNSAGVFRVSDLNEVSGAVEYVQEYPRPLPQVQQVPCHTTHSQLPPQAYGANLMPQPYAPQYQQRQYVMPQHGAQPMTQPHYQPQASFVPTYEIGAHNLMSAGVVQTNVTEPLTLSQPGELLGEFCDCEECQQIRADLNGCQCEECVEIRNSTRVETTVADNANTQVQQTGIFKKSKPKQGCTCDNCDSGRCGTTSSVSGHNAGVSPASPATGGYGQCGPCMVNDPCVINEWVSDAHIVDVGKEYKMTGNPLIDMWTCAWMKVKSGLKRKKLNKRFHKADCLPMNCYSGAVCGPAVYSGLPSYVYAQPEEKAHRSKTGGLFGIGKISLPLFGKNKEKDSRYLFSDKPCGIYYHNDTSYSIPVGVKLKSCYPALPPEVFERDKPPKAGFPNLFGKLLNKDRYQRPQDCLHPQSVYSHNGAPQHGLPGGQCPHGCLVQPGPQHPTIVPTPSPTPIPDGSGVPGTQRVYPQCPPVPYPVGPHKQMVPGVSPQSVPGQSPGIDLGPSDSSASRRGGQPTYPTPYRTSMLYRGNNEVHQTSIQLVNFNPTAVEPESKSFAAPVATTPGKAAELPANSGKVKPDCHHCNDAHGGCSHCQPRSHTCGHCQGHGCPHCKVEKKSLFRKDLCKEDFSLFNKDGKLRDGLGEIVDTVRRKAGTLTPQNGLHKPFQKKKDLFYEVELEPITERPERAEMVSPEFHWVETPKPGSNLADVPGKPSDVRRPDPAERIIRPGGGRGVQKPDSGAGIGFPNSQSVGKSGASGQAERPLAERIEFPDTLDTVRIPTTRDVKSPKEPPSVKLPLRRGVKRPGKPQSVKLPGGKELVFFPARRGVQIDEAPLAKRPIDMTHTPFPNDLSVRKPDDADEVRQPSEAPQILQPGETHRVKIPGAGEFEFFPKSQSASQSVAPLASLPAGPESVQRPQGGNVATLPSPELVQRGDVPSVSRPQKGREVAPGESENGGDYPDASQTEPQLIDDSPASKSTGMPKKKSSVEYPFSEDVLPNLGRKVNRPETGQGVRAPQSVRELPYPDSQFVKPGQSPEVSSPTSRPNARIPEGETVPFGEEPVETSVPKANGIETPRGSVVSSQPSSRSIQPDTAPTASYPQPDHALPPSARTTTVPDDKLTPRPRGLAIDDGGSNQLVPTPAQGSGAKPNGGAPVSQPNQATTTQSGNQMVSPPVRGPLAARPEPRMVSKRQPGAGQIGSPFPAQGQPPRVGQPGRSNQQGFPGNQSRTSNPLGRFGTSPTQPTVPGLPSGDAAKHGRPGMSNQSQFPAAAPGTVPRHGMPGSSTGNPDQGMIGRPNGGRQVPVDAGANLRHGNPNASQLNGASPRNSSGSDSRLRHGLPQPSQGETIPQSSNGGQRFNGYPANNQDGFSLNRSRTVARPTSTPSLNGRTGPNGNGFTVPQNQFGRGYGVSPHQPQRTSQPQSSMNGRTGDQIPHGHGSFVSNPNRQTITGQRAVPPRPQHPTRLGDELAPEERKEEDLAPDPVTDPACRWGYFKPSGSGGKGTPIGGYYSAAYPVNPWYQDPRDSRIYSAQGYGVPMAVPLAPTVTHTYNYGWGVPSSRMTPLSWMKSRAGFGPHYAPPNRNVQR